MRLVVVYSVNELNQILYRNKKKQFKILAQQNLKFIIIRETKFKTTLLT